LKNIWERHKGKAVAAVIVIAVLTAAFFWGGNYSKNAGSGTASAAAVTNEPSPSVSALSSSSEPEQTDNSASSPTTEEKTGKTQTDNSQSPSKSVSPTSPVSPSAGNNITSPVPSAEPEQAGEQSGTVGSTQETCTLSVSCATILNNMSLLDKDKWSLVPKDGSIFAAKSVGFNEGESVFNVLQREMKKAGIQMEFKDTPMYNSAYIEGINNLYEFDGGELSGWVYEVNGTFPNYGCSRYILHDGDVVNWLYTCDLGKDVGGNNSTGS
jgi:hypothetical protein